MFVTVYADSETELGAKIAELRGRGFTQIGSPVSTRGAAGMAGQTGYVCLMSRYASGVDAAAPGDCV